MSGFQTLARRITPQLLTARGGLNSGIRTNTLKCFSCSSNLYSNSIRFYSADASESAPAEVNPKVRKIVDEITELNLKDVASLVETLKNELNLPDTPMGGGFAMPMMAGGAAPAAAGGAAPEEAAEAAEEVKAIVTLQLDGFDEKSKIKVIKEVKSITSLGLKEAKALVESCPKPLAEDMKREEAEKLLEALEAVGAKVSLV